MSFDGNRLLFEFYAPDFNTQPIDPLIAVVGEEIEFANLQDFDQIGGIRMENANVDISGTNLSYQLDQSGDFGFGNVDDEDGFYGFVVSDLDDTLPAITGVGIVQSENTLGLPTEFVWFNEDRIFVNFDGLSFRPPDEGFRLIVEFAEDDSGTASDDALFVARAYTATFGRDPDIAGLNFWIGVLDQLGGPQALAEQFLFSDEFAANVGDPEQLSDVDFVSQLFRNVLGREGEQVGVDFWTGLLEGEELTQVEVLEAFIVSAENVENTERFDFVAFNIGEQEWDILG